MKQVILILCAAASVAACTRPDQARQVLAAQGYTEIETTGYHVFGCSDNDQFSTGFRARSVNGQRVRGVVCSGFLKGATVRVQSVE